MNLNASSNQQEPKSVLERIGENMFAVFDESKSDLIVLAATLESASTAFDNILAIARNDLGYYQDTIVMASKLIDWQEYEVDPKRDGALVEARNFIKRLQAGETNIQTLVAEADGLLTTIDAFLTEDRVKPRMQRRTAYRVRKIAGEREAKLVADMEQKA